METNPKNLVGNNVSFATWKELLIEYFKQTQSDVELTDFLKSIESRITEVQNLFENNQPEAAMRIMNNSQGNYIPNTSYNEILSFLNHYRIGNNQFYTVYDSKQNRYLFVDEKVSEILGKSSQEFSIDWFLDNSENGFINQEDYPHVIRWAGIAYSILSMPIFSFKVNQEYYKISFRPNEKITKATGIKQIEKKSYLTISNENKDLSFPSLHFDVWTCNYDQEDFTVRPQFVSDHNQTIAINSLTYLLNAFLIGFPTKYLLMLDERIHSDRNKDVANNLNSRINSKGQAINPFSEQSIGDTFAKTIRKKVSETNRIWSFSKMSATSEPESIGILKSLGLLPIPQNIKDMMFERIE